MPSNDPHFANVAALLHMDDLGLTDVKGRAVSKASGAVRTAAQSKWGGYSAAFNGATYLQVPASSDWFFGTDAFTIECWVYIAANSATDGSGLRNAQLWTNMSTSYGGFGFQIVGNGSTTGTGIGWEDKYGGSNIGASWTTAVSQGAWHHVAVCREAGGSNLYLCLDGTVQTSAITGGGSRSLGSPSYAAQIGGQPGVTSWNRYLNGYIDDFRITKGVARYTANYTPPAAPFPDYGRFVAGTLIEDTPHTEFRVRAHRLDTGALLNEVAVTGSAYEVPCCPVAGRADFTGPVIVVAHPRMGMQWTARTQKFVGDYVVPTIPADTPYVYKCTSVGLTDSYSASVKALCHFEGADDSTTGFIDETGRIMTPSGNVKQENTQKKFGSTAAYFDGTGDYISWSTGDDSFAFGGDFTAECWVYLTASRAHTIFDQRASASATGFVLATDSNNKIGVYFNGEWRIQGAAGLSQNTWIHLAVVRSSGTFALYVDGSSIGTYSSAAELVDGMARIGADFQAGQGMLGYMDELRVTKGVARYTGNFTPAASAFDLGTGSSEPTWPTTEGATVDDNDVRWTCVGRMVKPVAIGPLVPSL